MGRARGGTANATAGGAGGRRDAAAAGPLPGALNNIVRSMGAVGSSLRDLDNYLADVNERASQKAAGRGGRLFIAFQDLLDARELAHSPSAADAELASAMTDNALWHAGSLLATFDPKSPMLPPFRQAIAGYGAARGPQTVSYLTERGLLDHIPAETRSRWAQTAADGYVEAFGTARGPFSKKGEKRPEWRALVLMDRAARAHEQLQAVQLPEGSDLARLRDDAVKQSDKLIRNCQNYLADPNGENSDVISRTGPEEATRVQLAAGALTTPEGLNLNARMQAANRIQQSRDTVSAATGRRCDTPVLAVTDARWLNQTMDYSVTLAGEAGGHALAVNSEGKRIFVAPQVAEDVITGGGDGIIRHEFVHTTQDKAKGSPLPDRAHPDAIPYGSRHYIFEQHLLEGATQGFTNMLGRADGTPIDSDVYPTFTQMCDIACETSGAAPADFYRELNATPTNQRTAFLARTVCGDDSDRAQRDLFEPLLAANFDAEERAYHAGGWNAGVLADHAAACRRVFAGARRAIAA